jgi:ABC-2 type transport system ATP-binding protein
MQRALRLRMVDCIGVVPHPREVGHVAADPVDLLVHRAVGVVMRAHQDLSGRSPQLRGPFAAHDVQVAADPARGDHNPFGADRGLLASRFGNHPATAHGAVLLQQLRHPRAKTHLELRTAGMALNRLPHRIDERLAAAPGEVKPGHRVTVAVHAALGPVDDRKEADAVRLEPPAHLVPRAGDVRLRPALWPLVAVLELGHAPPILERELDAVPDPGKPLLTRVDHEHSTEGLASQPPNLIGRTPVEEQNAHVGAFEQLQRGDQAGQASPDHHNVNLAGVEHAGTLSPTGRRHASTRRRVICIALRWCLGHAGSAFITSAKAPRMSRSADESPAGHWRGWPIEARGLTKRYRGAPVIDGIELAVGPGEIYGFLGPNGAGKTTTMRMLLGLVRRDEGAIRLFGRDPAEDALAALQEVAGIIEEPRLYPYLSARANLQLLSDLDMGRGSRRVEEVLETVELRDRAKDRVGEYSQGMRQRLGIAACLVRNPKLLMLDEPANGVDPAGMRFLRQLLLRLAEDGVTVFLSSHLLAEVQEVCTRVAIVAGGRIAYEGALEDLLARAGRRYWLETADVPATAGICRELSGLSGVEVAGERVGFAIETESALLDLAGALTSAEIAIQSLVGGLLARGLQADRRHRTGDHRLAGRRGHRRRGRHGGARSRPSSFARCAAASC